MRLKFVFLATLLLCSAGIACAQSSADPKPATTPVAKEKPNPDAELYIQIVMEGMNARLYALDPVKNKDHSGATSLLVELYAKAVQRPGTMRLLVGDVLGDYVGLREGAKGAAQVSQAADEAKVRMDMIIVAQNQRIIELLEQLVKKR